MSTVSKAQRRDRWSETRRNEWETFGMLRRRPEGRTGRGTALPDSITLMQLGLVSILSDGEVQRAPFDRTRDSFWQKRTRTYL